jgi:hypothetical protein
MHPRRNERNAQILPFVPEHKLGQDRKFRQGFRPDADLEVVSCRSTENGVGVVRASICSSKLEYSQTSFGRNNFLRSCSIRLGSLPVKATTSSTSAIFTLTSSSKLPRNESTSPIAIDGCRADRKQNDI